MARYLATFSDTLGDIEINGFVTMTDKEVEHFEELAASITWDIVYKLGEEQLEYSSGEDLLTRIDFKEISNEEYKALKKLFDGKFGVFIDEDALNENLGDIEEEEEEEEEEENDSRYGKDDDDDY
jgi:hypothetical protein